MSDKVAPCLVTNGISESKDQKLQDVGKTCCSQRTSTDHQENFTKCPIMSEMSKCIREENEEGHEDNERKTLNSNSDCSACSSCNRSAPKKPVRSASGNVLSQDTRVIPNRKTSNISNVSMASSSAGSDETEGDRKLDLRRLIESIGTLLIPVVSIL